MTNTLAPSESEDPQIIIQNLIDRCQIINDEVVKYIAAADAIQDAGALITPPVEYRSLRSGLKSELAFLIKLKSSDLSAEKARNQSLSPNLVYYEALWAAAKRSAGLLSFRKYFFWNRPNNRKDWGSQGVVLTKRTQNKAKENKSAALVDIVADDGAEWVRISTSTEKRLLFDLAKLGWQNDSDSDDVEDGSDMPPASNSNWEDEDDEDQVDLVKNARELARAARANPTQGRPPRVRVVLTRIESGKIKEIDSILDKVRATGAVVQCANEIPETPSLDTALPNMLVNQRRSLSETFNIDCTILLSLISDISHQECPILDWYQGEVRAQILEEEKEKLLPTHLYPTISSRPMMCTEEAANQMNLITDTLGTDSEKLRADILLAQRSRENVPREALLKEWCEISDHPIPDGFQLPIRMVPGDLDQNIERLPKVAKTLTDELGPLNSTIFFYGWAEGLTTLSTNRARARQIEVAIDQVGLEDGEAGPHIWLFGKCRSLIARQGRRG